MEAVTGVVLVGGASRRFGSPKAIARIHGRTLAEIAWEHLAWCDERIAVGKVADGLPLDLPLHEDGTTIRAAMAGVAAGLRLARHELCLFLPVDMPWITDDAVRMLVSACAEVAVPQTGPLPGAYRRRTLPVFERRLACGEWELRAALGEFDTRVVELDLELLANVNRPEDMPAGDSSAEQADTT
jgi:molybdopterin-guanine dinucleotide biosynthesis protein A